MKSMIASLAIEHKSSEVSSHITASFGVSVMDLKKGGDHKMLVKQADTALSQAKKKGRNRMVQFKETSNS
jgi:diguanylate cyclase (GGDEF)-like protein